MSDKKGSNVFESLQTFLIFLLLVGVCVWVGMVIAAQGARKLENACLPVEYVTNFLHEFVATATSQQATWTLNTQRYLMSGCYYFARMALVQSNEPTGPETVGGIRMGDEML
jgi:hypothetical protein